MRNCLYFTALTLCWLHWVLMSHHGYEKAMVCVYCMAFTGIGFTAIICFARRSK